MLKNYFKIALRNVLSQKGYSFINIFGLGLGIALCLFILLYVRHQLSYDRFHEDSEKIYRVHIEIGEEGVVSAVTPSMVAPTLSDNFSEVQQWVRLYEPTRYGPIVLRSGDEVYQEENFLYADSTFFKVFSFDLLLGNRETVLARPNTIVLTRSTANKLFKGYNPIGKTVEAQIFGERVDFEITGIMEDFPANSHFSFDYIASLHTRSGWSQLTDSQLRSSNFYSYLKLTGSGPGLAEKLGTQGTELIHQSVPDQYAFSISLFPMEDIYLRSAATSEIQPVGSINNVIGFTSIAILILLIAVTNYMNLTTARAVQRASEVGVRKSLGAGRPELIKQFYIESFVLVTLALGLGLLLVEFFKPFFLGILGDGMVVDLFMDPSNLWLLLTVYLLTILLGGSYPALQLSSFQPVEVLKGSFKAGAGATTLRKGLVVFQYAISVFLIIGTMVVYQQTDFILTKDLGFEEEGLLVLPVDDYRLSEIRPLLKKQVLQVAGTSSASYISNIPGKVFGGYTAEHQPGGERIKVNAAAADSNIVETMELSLLAGSGLPDSPSYTNEQGYRYLVNRSLVNSYDWTPKEAIGKAFNVLGGRQGHIVGVVEDFNFSSLKNEVEPLAIFIEPSMYDHLLVKMDVANTTGMLSSLERIWSELAPHRPFTYEFLDRQLASLYDSELRTKNLFLVFAILSVFIASLGLFGLSSYVVQRRTKEIGVRKVLGAQVASIINLLNRDFLKLVALGFLIALPVSWIVMNYWLQEFAYRITIGVEVFLVAAFVILVVALLTVSGQSVKAALQNPVDTLRSE